MTKIAGGVGRVPNVPLRADELREDDARRAKAAEEARKAKAAAKAAADAEVDADKLLLTKVAEKARKAEGPSKSVQPRRLQRRPRKLSQS